jgi:hypothetical protein
MERIIFHIPYLINLDHPSGSQIRPMRLRKAFENLNYDVDFIEGNGKKRAKKIAEIKQNIRSGVKYKFLYSESSTEPTMLTEPHHFPTFPLLDFGFFRFCKKNDIPIGLFYRDIFWKFSFYSSQLSFFKRTIARLFYRIDLKLYQKYVDVLFLPSLRMLKYVPIDFKGPVADLPPAALFDNEIEKLESKLSDFGRINILYVGGIGDLYRMHLLFACANEIENVFLTICCRPDDWEKVKGEYADWLTDKVRIIHEKDEGLIPFYKEADLLSLFIEDHSYWEFVMALKLFEYLKHQKPIIAIKGTAVGEFVDSKNIGWQIRYEKDAFKILLDSIRKDQSAYVEKQSNMPVIIHQNTWEFRAGTVVRLLERSQH